MSNKNDIKKARELAKKQAEKSETLKAGACFGACNLTDKKCLTCLVLVECNQSKTDNAIKAAKETVTKKSNNKKTAKLLTLSQVFFLAVSQQDTLFTMSELLTSFMVLAEKLTAKKPSKKSSYGRSFSAHLTNALLQKEAVFYERGLSFVEHDLHNFKVVKM